MKVWNLNIFEWENLLCIIINSLWWQAAAFCLKLSIALSPTLSNLKSRIIKLIGLNIWYTIKLLHFAGFETREFSSHSCHIYTSQALAISETVNITTAEIQNRESRANRKGCRQPSRVHFHHNKISPTLSLSRSHFPPLDGGEENCYVVLVPFSP